MKKTTLLSLIATFVFLAITAVLARAMSAPIALVDYVETPPGHYYVDGYSRKSEDNGLNHEVIQAPRMPGDVPAPEEKPIGIVVLEKIKALATEIEHALFGAPEPKEGVRMNCYQTRDGAKVCAVERH